MLLFFFNLPSYLYFLQLRTTKEYRPRESRSPFGIETNFFSYISALLHIIPSCSKVARRNAQGKRPIGNGKGVMATISNFAEGAKNEKGCKKQERKNILVPLRNKSRMEEVPPISRAYFALNVARKPLPIHFCPNGPGIPSIIPNMIRKKKWTNDRES